LALSDEFRKMVKETIESEMEAIVRYPKDLAAKNFWGCENQFDFEYGWHIGYLEAIIYASFLGIHNKVPNRDEELEIKRTIASHANDIKKSLAKRKGR
jgi:hypothetical protein